MAESIANMSVQARLRLDAEARLKMGSAPLTQGWSLSADALAILYRLASVPETAGEGLKLLHELQTHQVELDLQHEQLVLNEREFAQELVHYKALYDNAPVPYFVVGRDGRILESNQAAVSLFGAGPGELDGRSIHGLVQETSRPVLSGLLDTLNAQGIGASGSVCVGAAPAASGGACDLRISASVSPDGNALLMLVCRYD